MKPAYRHRRNIDRQQLSKQINYRQTALERLKKHAILCHYVVAVEKLFTAVVPNVGGTARLRNEDFNSDQNLTTHSFVITGVSVVNVQLKRSSAEF